MKRSGLIAQVRKPVHRASGKPKDQDWSPEVRAAALERAGGLCELQLDGHCGGLRPGSMLQLHHRLLRRHGNHLLENAIVTCSTCHQGGPKSVHRIGDLAYTNGWLLKAHEDPIEVGWVRRGVLFRPTARIDNAEDPRGE